jgi:hypothetical protein
MTRHRFRAADPSQGRSLRNDPGVEAARRRRRSIALSVMLAGQLASIFRQSERCCARARVAKQQTKMPHEQPCGRIGFSRPRGGKELGGFQPSEKSRHFT